MTGGTNESEEESMFLRIDSKSFINLFILKKRTETGPISAKERESEKNNVERRNKKRSITDDVDEVEKEMDIEMKMKMKMGM